MVALWHLSFECFSIYELQHNMEGSTSFINHFVTKDLGRWPPGTGSQRHEQEGGREGGSVKGGCPSNHNCAGPVWPQLQKQPTV